MSFADIKIQTGGLFLKIESGHPMVVRLLHDDPFQYTLHGFGKDIQEECAGEHCLTCQAKDADGKPTPHSKRRQRFKLNVFSHDFKKVMVWECGPQVMECLQNVEAGLVAQGLKILDVDLMASSSGEGMDKTYSVQPMLKSREVPTGLVLHKLDLPF